MASSSPSVLSSQAPWVCIISFEYFIVFHFSTKLSQLLSQLPAPISFVAWNYVSGGNILSQSDGKECSMFTWHEMALIWFSDTAWSPRHARSSSWAVLAWPQATLLPLTWFHSFWWGYVQMNPRQMHFLDLLSIFKRLFSWVEIDPSSLLKMLACLSSKTKRLTAPAYTLRV